MYDFDDDEGSQLLTAVAFVVSVFGFILLISSIQVA